MLKILPVSSFSTACALPNSFGEVSTSMGFFLPIKIFTETSGEVKIKSQDSQNLWGTKGKSKLVEEDNIREEITCWKESKIHSRESATDKDIHLRKRVGQEDVAKTLYQNAWSKILKGPQRNGANVANRFDSLCLCQGRLLSKCSLRVYTDEALWSVLRRQW